MRILKMALAAAALTTTPAMAAQYHAQPVATPAAAKFALRGAVWNCDGSGCSAARADGRPEVVCASLARKVGTLRSFSIGGAALAPDVLEKCNDRAD